MENLQNQIKKIQDWISKLPSKLEKFRIELIKTKDNLENFSKNFPDEAREFNKDLKNFNLGVCLWYKEEYPTVYQFLKIIKLNPLLLEIKKARQIVNEFNDLVNKVEIKCPSIFTQEFNETKELFFDISVKPIKILINKFRDDEYINEELSDALEIFKEKEYFKKTVELIKKYSEAITDVNVKTENPVIKIINFFNIFRKIEIPSETIDTAKELTNILNEKKKCIKKFVPKDIKKEVYKLLTEIKDIDSYNINFVKFIWRLYHILIKGSRNFKKDYKIKSKWSYRPQLKKFLQQKLIKKFPMLSRFLYFYLSILPKYRNIDSHEIPVIKRISDEGRYAYIQKTGFKKETKIDIQKAHKINNTYKAFIEALNII